MLDRGGAQAGVADELRLNNHLRTEQPLLDVFCGSCVAFMQCTQCCDASCLAGAPRHSPFTPIANLSLGAAQHLHANTSEPWRRIAERLAWSSAGALHLAVLGTCVTAGGGAGEFGRSWSARLHERLRRSLRGALSWPGRPPRLHTHVSAKNAVALSFFSLCTADFVPADADVVLLDTGLNLFEARADARPALDELLSRVRAAAPAAALAFVVWLRPEQMDICPFRNCMRYTTLAAVRGTLAAVAARHGLDVLHVSASLLCDAACRARSRSSR